MASDFRIHCEWDRNLLYVHLLGSFDEASASALIDALRDKCHEASVVFIKANGVTNLDDSGCDAFKKRLNALQDWCYRLVFMDQNAAQLKPEWIEFY